MKKVSSRAFPVQAGNADRPKAQHNRPVPGAKISGRFASTIGRRFPAERPPTTQGKTDAET
jgi:hypothetical protein